MNSRRREWLMATAGTVLLPGTTWSQSAQPEVSRRVVYGFDSGGVGGKIADLATKVFSSEIGKPYTVDYQTMSSSKRSCEIVKNAPPDGNTILQAVSFSLLLYPATNRQLSYGPSDFTPLVVMGGTTLAFTVGPRAPSSVTTLDHYLQWVTDNPAERNYGVIGQGSTSHLAGLSIARTKDVAIRAQPYSGVRALATDLLSSKLSAGFIPSGAYKAEIESGQLRQLGVTSKLRWPSLEKIPTLVSQGVTDLDISDWFGWFVRADTPPSLLSELRASADKILDNADYSKLRSDYFIQDERAGPSDVLERMRDESERFKRLVRLNRLSSAV
jgi:tripartite-type tricarboxylate transporter receptor subunit TctC